MTILEAYDLVLKKVEELKKEGIVVELTKIEAAEDIVSLAELPPEKWVNIHLLPKNPEEWDKVWKADEDLSKQGISFDTGIGFGGRDWQIDWSLRVEVKEDKYLDSLGYLASLSKEDFKDLLYAWSKFTTKKKK